MLGSVRYGHYGGRSPLKRSASGKNKIAHSFGVTGKMDFQTLGTDSELHYEDVETFYDEWPSFMDDAAGPWYTTVGAPEIVCGETPDDDVMAYSKISLILPNNEVRSFNTAFMWHRCGPDDNTWSIDGVVGVQTILNMPL